jgi:hypothetical protein
MPVTPDAINSAIQEGYTPDQIIQHIQTKYPEYQQRLKDAANEGYSSSEIVEHLRTKGFSPVAQPEQQQAPGQQSDLSIPEQRAQMGLNTIHRGGPLMGQRIQTISPGEMQLGASQKKIEEGANAPTTPDPKGWRGFVPGFSIARGAENVGKAWGAGKADLAQTAGLGVDIASTVALAGQGGTLSGPLTKALNLPFKYGGKLLSATVGRIPVVRSTTEKLAARITSWAVTSPLLSHGILSRMMNHEADTYAAYREVDALGTELGKHNMSQDSLAKVFDAYEAAGKSSNPALTNPSETDQAVRNLLGSLSEKEKTFLKHLLPIKKGLTEVATKEGVIKEANDWYFTHLYNYGKARSFFSTVMKTAPTAMKRTFSTFAELAETQSKIKDELEAKGLKVIDALKMPDEELKKLGFNPSIKNTMSLEPIKNPIKAVQAQLLATRMAIATKKNVMTLADLADETGSKLIENAPGPGRVKLNSRVFNEWVVRSLKAGDTRLVKFADKDAYIIKKYAGDVNRMLRTDNMYPDWLKGVKEVNRVTKFLRFFNPAVHNLNEFSSALQYFNGNVFKALGIPGKAIARDPNRLSEAIADGFQTQHFYKLQQSLAKDFGVIMGKYKLPYVTDMMDAVQKKFTDPLLWNHVEHIGLTVWDSAKQKLMFQGIPEKEAGQAAVTLAHDVIGKMTSYTSMSMFKNPYVNAFVNFIPSWVNSSMRKYIGAVLPEQAFQHLPEITRKALQVEYQHNLMSGVTMGYMISQRLSYAMTGHSTFENLPENRPSFAHPFGKLEMTFGGKLYSVDLPLMGSLTLPPRMLMAIYNLGRGNPQGAMGMLQPIASAPAAYAMEAYRTKSPMAGMRAAGQQLSPMAQYADPKKSAGEITLNSVLPFRLQQADPRTDVVKKVWTMYKNENKFEIIGEQEPWKNDLDKTIQAKDYDKAGQIVRMHYVGSRAHEFFQHRMLKFTKPNTYTYLMIPKEKRNNYLQRLDPTELERFQQAIKKEATPEGSTP